MPLVLRLVKGSPLTNAEVDGNFTYLNTKPAGNLAGGAAGSIPYQSATDTTSFLAAGSSGYVLTAAGSGAAPTWKKAASGAAGGGNDLVFYENDQSITTDYSITTNKNAGTFGPVTVNDGVTVTIPDGSVWTIV